MSYSPTHPLNRRRRATHIHRRSLLRVIRHRSNWNDLHNTPRHQSAYIHTYTSKIYSQGGFKKRIISYRPPSANILRNDILTALAIKRAGRGHGAGLFEHGDGCGRDEGAASCGGEGAGFDWAALGGAVFVSEWDV